MRMPTIRLWPWAAAILTTPAALSALLCGCGTNQPPASTTSATLYEVHCTEHLPVFTLGKDSHPTKTQEAALCACIWNELGTWERGVSEPIYAHESAVSEFYQRAFIARFGAAVDKCGGMNL